MKDLSFEQYYPTSSFVHKMDARIKILLMVVYIVAIFFIKGYFGYAVTALLLLSTSLISRVPITKVLKSVKHIAIIVVITALLNLFFIKEGNLLASWWIFKITDCGLNMP